MSRYSVCTTALLIVSYGQCTVHTCIIFYSLSLFLSPVFVMLFLSHLGGCPLNRPLHIGGRTSPLPRAWCPHTVPVLGLDRRLGSNWKGPVAGTLHQALTLSTNWHCERPAAGLRYGSASIDGWILASGRLLSDKRGCTVNLLPQPQRTVYVLMYVTRDL